MKATGKVKVWEEKITLPTWMPALPDKNPIFLEKRVYQGSDGKVYPLPFTDRVAHRPIPRSWRAIWLENQYLRVMVLPELGGRIHVAQDKTNDYDFIYRQQVIKPALVGLAGPWVSGGIEFNWPQHHRPSTFLPCEVHVEKNRDGSCTVWLSEHDPMARMKGMHGVCLHPDRAVLEIKARVYNRTQFTQTFLWWVNAGIHVHEAYQSFFPPDVHYVADHARRALSRYPLCEGTYYGVDYGKRAKHGVVPEEKPPCFVPPHCGGQAPVDYPPNDLSWYANIPTPCSYMALGTDEDFLGGYDHFREAGVVHVADHHIAPGKKQWTWGNHPFGYAWDRNLTEEDGPYIELMAGVYTDNQPDFSFLAPGETRVWKQVLYPVQKIGPAHKANEQAAVHLGTDHTTVRIGVSVTRTYPDAVIRLERSGGKPLTWRASLAPGQPFFREQKTGRIKSARPGMTLRVLDQDNHEIIAYSPSSGPVGPAPPPASEPAVPGKVASMDELYLTGLHLEQYRHATRCPTLYWREGLRRDPGDARCHTALGRWHLRRGEFAVAIDHCRAAIQRLTLRNFNPADGEAYYLLAQCLRYQCDLQPESSTRQEQEDAYAALAKATWNAAWSGPAHFSLAEWEAFHGRWEKSLHHLDLSLRLNQDHLKARNLKALVLVQLQRPAEAGKVLRETLRLDPLDAWARQLRDGAVHADGQTTLDVAHDYARAGFLDRAIGLLEDWLRQHPRPNRGDLPTFSWGVHPIMHYTLAWFYDRTGRLRHAQKARRKASTLTPDYCFPARLEEIAVLSWAIQAEPDDGRARYYLGNLFHDRKRHAEARRLWEESARLDPSQAVVWRNLGLVYHNIFGQPKRARAAYEKAVRAHPRDARLLYERDQLWKLLGISARRRLAALQPHARLIRQRDDLSVEFAALYNLTNQPDMALEVMSNRRFQPWEGGEGAALGQYVQARLALGCQALLKDQAGMALEHFQAALSVPDNLGEVKHLLANQSDLHFWLGCAYDAKGQEKNARRHWRSAAESKGDFVDIKRQPYSEMTMYTALSMIKLGERKAAGQMLRSLRQYAKRLARQPAVMDYFVTSRPATVLMENDQLKRQQTRALFLEAQAQAGLGHLSVARELIARVKRRDPGHYGAVALAKNLLT